MSIIEYLLVIGCAYVAVNFIVQILNLEKKQTDASDIDVEYNIEIDIQKIDNMYYIWNVRDNSFLAQGKNIDEIRKICEIRYPGCAIIANVDQINSLDFKI